MFVFNLTKNSGFFSELFFMVNYYLICERNKTPFSIDSSSWLFKYKKGWHDYYNSLDEFSYNTPHRTIPYRIPEEINFSEELDFTLNDYKEAIKKIFILNDRLKDEYNSVVTNLKLPLEYDSIFIRRGDKMIKESLYLHTHKYIDALVEKHTKAIFIQTDDYSVFEEAEEYIHEKQYNIQLFTTCPETKKGTYVFGIDTSGSSLSKENDEYIKNQKNNTNLKSVIMMNDEEIYEHTKEMIIGLEICKNSRYICLDYQSNVSRYLLLVHDNIIDIQNTYIDFNKPILCPTIGFKYKN